MPTNVVLPDFEDMLKVAEQIRDQLTVRDTLDIQIKQRESEIYKITSTDSTYFIGGKPPSATFVKETYEFTGLSGELIPLRQAYANAVAQLEFLRLAFDMMKMQVDLYRTESANQRFSNL